MSHPGVDKMWGDSTTGDGLCFRIGSYYDRRCICEKVDGGLLSHPASDCLSYFFVHTF